MLQDDFLLFTDGPNGHIWQMGLDGSNLELILDDQSQNPVAVDYDPLNKKIYFTDVDDPRISRMNLDGTGQEIIIQLTPGALIRLIKILHCSYL